MATTTTTARMRPHLHRHLRRATASHAHISSSDRSSSRSRSFSSSSSSSLARGIRTPAAAAPSVAASAHADDDEKSDQQAEDERTKWTERVLSGIQPTGVPHLGNYCGAISKWVDLQSDGGDSQQQRTKRLYSVVDLHAITVPFDPRRMPTQIRSMVAALLGAGLDPQQNVLFKQSDVHFHTELAWYLGCITPIGWLNRMTQYKQKAQGEKMESGLGLLAYPVLMAADILVYKATHIPVGEDQTQHLELARMIAATFNDRFGREVFPKPFPAASDKQEALYRIMSLREPTAKMSKSDASPLSRIELTDSADAIRKKIMKAQTDAIEGIFYDKATRPGVANLLSIFSAVTDQSVDALVDQYATSQTGAFKQSVADAVIAKICPIGERIQQFEADPLYIDAVLADGAEQASEIAAATMKEVKDAMGL